MKQDKPSPKRYWWFWVIGLFALLWVLVRSGTNPKRLTYPCQQAAFPLASAWVIAVIGLLGGGLFFKKLKRISAVAAVLAGVVFLGVSTGRQAVVPEILPVWEADNPVSTVFVMNDIPVTSGSLAPGDASVPDEYLSDPAMDTLLAIMEAKDVFLHKTAGHSEGIVGSEDVVIIKGNFQWTSRNTTSTDRIKGLIWQILNHPDGFSGEIIICDNTQEIGTGIGENDNNSEDKAQSIPDVVDVFHAKGYPVYYRSWADMWNIVVDEYSEGNNSNGYTYDYETKVSYPKFRSPSGDYYISLRYGLWDPESEIYEADKLCIIDFPVLKAHSLAGATIALKNWIGVLTTAYYNERYGSRNSMHSSYFWGDYALVARVMEVTYPRLTIIDAAWTTTEGPINLTNVVQTNMLLASQDPVASSWYAAKFILTPIANNPNQTNPDYEGSKYNTALGNWTNYLRGEAGLPCTKDSAEISVYDREVLAEEPGLIEAGPPPGFFELESIYPNPFSTQTTIRYSIAESLEVNLDIIDASGRIVRSLAEGPRVSGHYSVTWD
ncbi:DUF362 domain-containing protein, partial [candidate division WOR-3 bacterium]|nr:DUF362 domain-containing protein [candidate division WOR-3 bacterium]MBD3365545.1 DUF362 domain-containing protein [candidate division WOR-3 bacterium]